MQNRIKKAQSNVLAVVVLIALSIVLVGIVAYSIKQFATPALSPTACTEENINPSIDISYACLDSSKSQVQVTLERKITSMEISTIDLDVRSENTRGKWRCFAGCGDCGILEAGEKKTYYLDLDESPQSQTTIEIYSNGCKSAQLIQNLPSC